MCGAKVIEIMPEPTIEDLSMALNDCCEIKGYNSGMFHSKLLRLQELRNKKFTWIGKSELRIRQSIDYYLEFKLKEST